MMTTITLNKVWELGKQIDAGGFGKIYEGIAFDHTPVVIKLVQKDPKASRELLFEELSNFSNIIPILDKGEWEKYYVLVMPRAQKSLRLYIEENGGKLSIEQSLIVLTDIALGLASIKDGVVHRDLKPENILFYKDHWCLADFGIARYAQATTAPDTNKFSMSPQYASPEQWRNERATSATDIYAFGVVAFEITQGKLPFPGPDFREEHLTTSPPPVVECPSFLFSIIVECLYRPSSARPTPANILARLQKNKIPTSPAVNVLQSVNQAVVEKISHRVAVESAKESEEHQRAEIYKTADASIRQIIKTLEDSIISYASAAKSSPSGILSIQLDQGKLTVPVVKPATKGCLGAYGQPAPFDVIAYTSIAVQKPKDRYEYEGRSHSLWFCDAHNEGVYRWFELSFMIHPLIGGQRSTMDPFCFLQVGIPHFCKTFSPAPVGKIKLT